MSKPGRWHGRAVAVRRWAAERADGGFWWLAAAAAALVCSLLPPAWTWQRPLFEHVVVFDVTQSMNVTDQLLDGQPVSRLAYARHAMNQALPGLPCGSKLGWAVFTEYRSYLLFTPVEVCANRAELRASLQRIDVRMAWSGNSEVAKGLHSALVVSKALPGRPSIVFVTDGHEAPPLNPRYRPSFDDKPGEVAGLLVGVGETKPSPIPKTDPLGRPLGFWAADEVMQVDPRSLGRGGSVGSEMLVETEADRAVNVPALGLGATPGAEHLSGLRETYLRLLASENGLGYVRLRDGAGLLQALTGAELSRPVAVPGDARWPLMVLAFVLLLVPYLRTARRRWAARFAGRTPTRTVS